MSYITDIKKKPGNKKSTSKGNGKIGKVAKYGKKLLAYPGIDMPMTPTGQEQDPWTVQKPILGPDNSQEIEQGRNNTFDKIDVSQQPPIYPNKGLPGVTPDTIDAQHGNAPDKQRKPFNFGNGHFNTGDITAGLVQGINALIPNQPIQSNKKTLIDSYNPHPLGISGSKATFSKGGSLKKELAKNGKKLTKDQARKYLQKAKDGKDIQPTNFWETDKRAWTDSVINANTNKPWVKDLYNPNIKQPELQFYNGDEDQAIVAPSDAHFNAGLGIPFDNGEKADYFVDNQEFERTPIPADMLKKRFPKKANGGDITPEKRDRWNQYVNSKGRLGENSNHNKAIGDNSLNGYFDPSEISAFQQDFQNMSKGNSQFGQIGVDQVQQYPEQKVSQVDNINGTLTSNQVYPNMQITNEHYGQPSTVTNYGTNFEKGTRENNAYVAQQKGRLDNYNSNVRQSNARNQASEAAYPTPVAGNYNNSTAQLPNPTPKLDFNQGVSGEQFNPYKKTRQVATKQQKNWHTNKDASYMRNGGKAYQGVHIPYAGTVGYDHVSTGVVQGQPVDAQGRWVDNTKKSKIKPKREKPSHIDPLDIQYNPKGYDEVSTIIMPEEINVPQDMFKKQQEPQKTESYWDSKQQKMINGTFANGGYLEELGKGGLQVENNNIKPLSNDTGMITGASHKNGGVDISYNGKKVETEGKEPVHVDKRDSSLIVSGNLHIPSINTKFKDAMLTVGKFEKKTDKLKEKATYLSKVMDPHLQYQKSGFNTAKVLQDAVSQRQETSEDTKNYLTDVQNHMLDRSEELGIDPKDLSNLYKKAKYGLKITDKKKLQWGEGDGDNNTSMAEDGFRFDQNPTRKDKDKAIPYVTQDYGNFAPHQYQEPDVSDINNPMQKDYSIHPIDQSSPRMIRQGQTGQIDQMEGTGFKQFAQSPRQNVQEISMDSPGAKEIQKNADNVLSKFNDSTKKKPRGYREKLGIADVLPELATMFDKPDSVPVQQYNPSLMSPYQVSFEDRIAGNQGDFNALQKQYANNPAALGALQAQKYNTDNTTRAEEFRTNQGIDSQISNQNVGIINQAKEMNIKLSDEQYARQTQAKANTTENRYRAMDSLGAKQGQVRRDNASISRIEALQHYTWDPKTQQYIYTGPDTQFSGQTHTTDVQHPKKETRTQTKEDDGSWKTTDKEEDKMYGGMVAARGITPIKKHKNLKKKNRQYI